MNEQAQLLEKTSNDVDAVMDMAEEGAAWSVMYPQYSVVVPRPAIFVPVAYAVAKGNDDLLAALNAHLLLKTMSIGCSAAPQNLTDHRGGRSLKTC
jgi:hypothetical protein